MNRMCWELIAACLTSLVMLIPAADAQNMSGMVAPINQAEAIEAHLQQSRTQSSRETEESVRKKTHTSELPKPVTKAQVSKQRRAEGEGEKAPAGNTMKNE